MCSLPTTTNGGNYVIILLESYGSTLSLLFIVLIETITVCWIYGVDRFCLNLQEMYGKPVGLYWRLCWKYFSPTILISIFCAALYLEAKKTDTLKYGNYVYPHWAIAIGWLMTGASVCCIPVYAICLLCKTKGDTLFDRLKIATKPINDDESYNQQENTEKYRDIEMSQASVDLNNNNSNNNGSDDNDDDDEHSYAPIRVDANIVTHTDVRQANQRIPSLSVTKKESSIDRISAARV